jgi:hypothetical protein
MEPTHPIHPAAMSCPPQSFLFSHPFQKYPDEVYVNKRKRLIPKISSYSSYMFF